MVQFMSSYSNLIVWIKTVAIKRAEIPEPSNGKFDFCYKRNSLFFENFEDVFQKHLLQW